jgi:hypothetical protein
MSGLTVGLSGSGGVGETLYQLCTISGKPTLVRAAKPLPGWGWCWVLCKNSADQSFEKHLQISDITTAV